MNVNSARRSLLKPRVLALATSDRTRGGGGHRSHTRRRGVRGGWQANAGRTRSRKPFGVGAGHYREQNRTRTENIFAPLLILCCSSPHASLTNLFTRTCTARARERRAMANTPGSQLDDATPIASRSSARRRPLRFLHTRSAASGSIDADRSLACAPFPFIGIRSVHWLSVASGNLFTTAFALLS